MQPLTALLEKLPASDPASGETTVKALIQGGPALIAQLIVQVGQQFGDPSGVKAAYALHGATHYASRPGAEDERKMIAETMAKSLEAKHSADLKSFLCQQLQLCGRAEQVPALAGLLHDETLCEPATQALAAISGPAAAAAFRAALSSARGKPRVTIIYALGRLRDSAAADEIRKSVDEVDPSLRLAAWYALGNIGDAASAVALLKAADGAPSFERKQATDAVLRLARRLGELGHAAEAERLLRQLLTLRKTPEDTHERLAALECLTSVSSEKVMPDVLAALDSADLKYRTAAARIALDLGRMMQNARPDEAAKLLKKIVDVTQEEAVRQQAKMLLARQSK